MSKRDVTDSINDIFKGFDIRNKALEMKERFNLTEQEYLELQDAYFQEERGFIQTTVEEMLTRGIEAVGGKRPSRRSSNDILDAAKTRMQK